MGVGGKLAVALGDSVAVGAGMLGGMKGRAVAGICGMGKGVALGAGRVGAGVAVGVAVKTMGVWVASGVALEDWMRCPPSLGDDNPQIMKPRQ